MALKKWTEEEENIIRENAFIPMRELVAKLPGRERKVVYWKLGVLGFKRDGYARYSKEDDDYLRNNYQEKGNREIARFLKRTEKSIAKRMIVLGLKRTDKELYTLRSKNSGTFKKGCENKNKAKLGTLVLAYDAKNNKHYYRIKTEKGFVRFSRYLYEKYHNVELSDKDIVYHKDGNSMNVLIENLELVNRSELLQKNINEDEAFIKRIFRVNDPCVINSLKTDNNHLVQLKKAVIKVNQKIKENE